MKRMLREVSRSNLWCTGMAKRQSGKTLIEIIISSFIFGLLSLAVILLLRSVTHLVRKNEVLLVLQRESLVACTWLNADLTNSSVETFVDETGGGIWTTGITVGPGVVFAIPQSATGDVELDSAGRMLWRSIVAYYITPVEGTPCLVRRIKEIPASSRRPTLPTLADFHTDAAAESRVVARHIVEFHGDADPTPPFEFSFMCRRQGVDDFGILINNSAFFRN